MREKFFRISRSSWTIRNSFRSRVSSSRSAVVRPVLPFVRSARACSTQLRSDDSVKPRSRGAAAILRLRRASDDPLKRAIEKPPGTHAAPRPRYDSRRFLDVFVGMSLLTVRAAAERMGIKYSTLKHWIHQGKIRTTQTAGGHHGLSEAEVDRMLAKLKSSQRLLDVPQP